MMNVERLPTEIERSDKLPAPASEGSALISVIERVALNPHVDVDKLERLLAMQQAIMAQNAKAAFAGAMTAAQAEIEPVARDAKNTQTKTKYASYAAIDAAIRAIYTAHGFGPSFDTADGAPPDHVRVVCELMHEGGHSRTYHFDVPADGKGAKGGDVMTKTHAAVSAISYGQRTLVRMIFNVATFDDDGNAAGAVSGEKINADDIQNLRDMMKARGCPESDFLKWAKVQKMEDIPVVYYDSCVNAIGQFRKQKAPAQ